MKGLSSNLKENSTRIFWSIKESVRVKKIGMKVRTIKKTARGDLMMEIEGGKHKAEVMKKAILDANKDPRVRVRNNDELVTDIDAALSKDEIAEAIKKVSEMPTQMKLEFC